MADVTITVTGPIGSGKSALCKEIEILCRALGVPCEWEGGQRERNLSGGDSHDELAMYAPTVTIRETLATPPAGAGEAVATVVGEQPVKTGPDGMPTRRAAGKMKMSVVLHRELPPGTKLYATDPSLAAAYLAQVMDEDMKPWRAMREGDAAPTPLPEAVREIALLREVCEVLHGVGCGPCIGSHAPMEDLHGRIARYLGRRPYKHCRHCDGSGTADAGGECPCVTYELDRALTGGDKQGEEG